MSMTGTPLTEARSLTWISNAAIEVETCKSSWRVLLMAVINRMSWIKLTPATGILTGGRSLISKAETEVETPRLRALCSITIRQYFKMQRTKLNAHTGASGNLCSCSPIRLGVASKNGWHGISGASSACRCESCWPRPMYGTERWLLGLENSLINALHIVDNPSVRVRTLDYIITARS